jgi:predicted TPR repeat methyltransferase
MTHAALAEGLNDAALQSVLAHALVAEGKLAEAAPHFIAASRLAPQDGYLAHLAAAANGSGTDRATDRYVASLFDGYAPRFEDSLLSLGYRVPGLIRQGVKRQLPAVAAGVAKLGPVLDLGCGTGFIGVALSDMLGGPLTGIDLSRGMLDQAAAKGLYASVQQVEISTALQAGMPPQALVIAADVFCYFGRLDEVLALCRRQLAPDGLLMFSVERIDPGEPAGEGWRLGSSGRYAHADAYLAGCLAATGLTALEWREEAVRLDAAGPVAGLLVVAQADPSQPLIH